jgi:hypothetical protein
VPLPAASCRPPWLPPTHHSGPPWPRPREEYLRSSRSKRDKDAADARGGDAELQHAWTMEGLPERYEGPGTQELKDLADPRNRGRGEREQRKRLKRGWQQLERETTSTEAAETETVLGPALPPYLLERGMLVGDEPSACRTCCVLPSSRAHRAVDVRAAQRPRSPAPRMSAASPFSLQISLHVAQGCVWGAHD